MPEWWETGFFKKEVGDFLFSDERWENAPSEVNFMEEMLELEPGDKILDLCCGVGRHAIYFAQDGFNVMGLDLSKVYLDIAAKKAAKLGVDVEWLKADMREIPFENEFDGIVNVFTSFGYFHDQDENQKVLDNVYKALKPGGRFLIELMNRDYLIKNFQTSSWAEVDGGYVLEERSFDPYHDMLYNRWIIIRENGEVEELPFSHHIYSAYKLNQMLHKAGFVVEEYFGDLTGIPFVMESKRLCALAYKKK